ncbi:MAG: response regulator transcription factor [Anaerolineaceae bacterium]|nr:response regulator transcription factor [Anaerolineaceae bacterium]
MLHILVVEDNEKLRNAMVKGLHDTGKIVVDFHCDSGEASLNYFSILNEQSQSPAGILMDVQLAGAMNGIQAAIEIRRENPRLPVVFYSIQDDDGYYRDFRNSGILSHYAYVKKSNYLLPQMILPLLQDAVQGRSFIDPEIEERVKEVWHRDENSPMSLLEPNEQKVAQMLVKGMTNEHIATVMGFRDKRTISRINGQIYSSWGLNNSTSDEKVARTRAVIIAQQDKMIIWDEQGNAFLLDDNGEQNPWH